MTQMQTRYEIYRDVDRRWRWRFRDDGGQDIAQSSHAYKDRGDCLRTIVCVRGSADSGIHQVRLPRRPKRSIRKPRGRVVDFPACNKRGVLEC